MGTYGAVKSFGNYIGFEKLDLCNKNCTKIYPDVEKLFESCKRRNKLTLFGKCTAINSLALTKLLYIVIIAIIVEIPDEKIYT